MNFQNKICSAKVYNIEFSIAILIEDFELKTANALNPTETLVHFPPTSTHSDFRKISLSISKKNRKLKKNHFKRSRYFIESSS